MKENNKVLRCGGKSCGWGKKLLGNRSLVNVIFLVGLVVSTGVYAEAWVFKPTLSLVSAYHDNRRLTTLPHESTTELTLSAVGDLSRRTETTDMRGRISLDFINYFNDEFLEDEDTNNQLFGFYVSHKQERNRFKLNSFYRRDTTLQTISGVIEDPEVLLGTPDDNADEGLFARSIRRNQFRIDPSWSYQLSEISSLDLSYGYQDVEYEDDPLINLNDYSVHDLEGRYGRRVSPTTRISLGLRGSYYDSDEVGTQYERASLDVKASKNFSETLYGELKVGYENISFDTNTESGDENGYSFSLSGRKKTELTIYRGRIQRRVSASGSGDAVVSNIIDLSADIKLAPRWRLYVPFYFNENEEIRQGTSESRYYRFRPRLSWNLSEWWFVNAEYEYRKSEFLGGTGDDPDSNAVFLSISYSKERFLE